MLVYIKKNHYYYWDPLTAFVLSHPEKVKYRKQMRLCVNTKSNSQQFGRVYPCAKGQTVSVVFAIDSTAFKQDFFQSLAN